MSMMRTLAGLMLAGSAAVASAQSVVVTVEPTTASAAAGDTVTFEVSASWSGLTAGGVNIDNLLAVFTFEADAEPVEGETGVAGISTATVATPFTTLSFDSGDNSVPPVLSGVIGTQDPFSLDDSNPILMFSFDVEVEAGFSGDIAYTIAQAVLPDIITLIDTTDIGNIYGANFNPDSVNSEFLLEVVSVPVTIGTACQPDYNGDGSLNTLDLIDFINDFRDAGMTVDYNGDGSQNTLDLIDFINDFRAGC